ncbi:MAG: hypothetical protein M1549_00450 [Candidatus Dependentiae bacterium]|nr:hypothetical protein [Candidatus Dependentiae bacterium]
MEAYFVDFDHDTFGELDVKSTKERSILASDVVYLKTKIRHTEDIIFAKGMDRIDAIDTKTGIHTKFASDYTIKDIFVSPDEKYLAICEKLGSSSYTYHVFRLEQKSLALQTYLDAMPAEKKKTLEEQPTPMFYGSQQNILAKVGSWAVEKSISGTINGIGWLMGYGG